LFEVELLKFLPETVRLSVVTSRKLAH